MKSAVASVAAALVLLLTVQVSALLVNPPRAHVNVYMKILLNSVDKIDDVEQIFTADFYFSAYWFDNKVAQAEIDFKEANVNNTDAEFELDPASEFDPSINFENLVGELSATFKDENAYYLNPNISASLPNVLPEDIPFLNRSWIEFNQRYRGDFATPLDLRDFPYDRQAMRMQINSGMWPVEQVGFQPAYTPDEFVARLMPADFQINEWEIKRTTLEVTEKFFNAYGLTYAWFEVNVNLARLPLYYEYKLVAGSILLVYMCFMIYSLSVDEADRMMGTLTCFLALISFVFVAGGFLPKVAYLTRIDVFFAWSFFTCFLIMLSHSVLYWWREDEDGDDDKKDDKKDVEMKGADEKKDDDKKEEKKQDGGFGRFIRSLGLPPFHTLTGQRKADWIIVIGLGMLYNIVVASILLPPVRDPPPPRSK